MAWISALSRLKPFGRAILQTFPFSNSLYCTDHSRISQYEMAARVPGGRILPARKWTNLAGHWHHAAPPRRPAWGRSVVPVSRGATITLAPMDDQPAQRQRRPTVMAGSLGGSAVRWPPRRARAGSRVRARRPRARTLARPGPGPRRLR